jgi:hypothetical protein
MMTDNEIIKALGCCLSRDGNCEQKRCPIIQECGKDLMAVERHALSLINRQKAEIERLQKHIQEGIDLAKQLPEMIRLSKTEAIKDVLLTLEAEAVSSDKYIREYDDSEVQKAYNQALWKAYNLVKEMVGDDK